MQFEELDDLYQDIILDHYRNPRNSAKLEEPHLKAEGNNPFCGDEVAVQISFDGTDHVREVGYQGRGCSISQASASIMGELLKGKTLKEIQAIHRVFLDVMQGKNTGDSSLEDFGDLQVLKGVRKFPIRIKCALLAWSILEDGIKEYDSHL